MNAVVKWLALLGVLCAGSVTVATGQVANPVLTPTQGTSSQNVSVIVTDTSPGITLCYTTDGSAPTVSSATVASGGSVVVPLNVPLKVQAYEGTANPSAVVTGQYTTNPFISAGQYHSLMLKTTGSAVAWGLNSSGQLGNGNTTNANTPVPFSLSGVLPIGSLTSKTILFDPGTGLPIQWELTYFGQTGQNPNALAPVGNGLTILQCYQQGMNPLQAPAAPYTVSLNAITTATTATLTLNTTNVPVGTQIQKVTFYQGDSLIGSLTQGPFLVEYFLNNLAPGNYPVRAVTLDSKGASATASSTVQVSLPPSNNTNWWYARGDANSPITYYSYVVPVDFNTGIMPYASGTNQPQGYAPVGFVGSAASFIALQPWTSGSSSPSQSWAPVPWFMQIAASGTAYYLSGTNSSGPLYSSSDTFTNPLAGFGSQEGTPIYVGQTYSFGVMSGGQNRNPSISATTVDLKVDVYAASSFVSGTANVSPVTTGTFHLPRPGEPDWDTFAKSGYQLPETVTASSGTNTGTFTFNIQLSPSGFGAIGSAGNYPLLVNVNSNSAAFYLRVSVRGAIQDANGNWDWMAVDNPSTQQTQQASGDYSMSFTMDFTNQGLQPWQSTIVDKPSFTGATPLPAAYQGMSEEDLLNLNPIMTGSDSLPVLTQSGSATYLTTGTTVSTVTSPELVDNPILDNFVQSMNNDPIALANYVQTQIGLVDTMGVPNTGGTINYSDQSINFGGVNRSALGVLLEGQGSPVEQCGLLVYLLRKAGYPAAYCFGQLDQMQMLSLQLSQMLQMQLNGAEDFGVTESSTGTTLIPVNYPWVVANIKGQWVHLFPWIKNTEVEDGYNLYDNLPQGYKTGAEWLRAYLYYDPKIRTSGSENYENPGVLFPQFVENNLPSNLSIDDIGVTIWNRPEYYSSWNEFPHPWSRPAVSGSNLYSDLMTYSKSTFSNTDKLFDTASVQVFSDRAGTGTYQSGDPVVTSGTLYTATLNDRRFLLYHTPAGSYPTNSGTTAWANYNMNLSLEAIAPMATGTEAFPPILTSTDQYLLNKQFSTASLTSSDSNLYMVINITRHRAAEVSNGSFPFLGVNELQQPTDTRPLRVGDTAGICFNFGQVSQWMLEAQQDKYWAAQQAIQQNPSLPFDIETAQGLPAYLMGMSYYYREGGFINQYKALTKTNIISSVAHGLAKLSPARISGSATLVNGQLNLRFPNVDMFHLQAVFAGDETVQPGSGQSQGLTAQEYQPIFIAASSAQEHLTIQQFFAAENDNAISTIKLMDIASSQSLSGTTYNYTDSTYGPLTVSVSPTAGITVTGTAGVLSVTGTGGLIELSNENYRALGQLMISGTQNGSLVRQSLQTWATNAGLWTSATNAFTQSDAEFHRVFMTPGPVSGAYSGTGSSMQAGYYGMGALIYGPYDAGALISPNLYGGAGSDDGTEFTYSNPTLADTVLTNDGIDLSNFGSSNTVVSTTYLGQTTSIANFGDGASNLEDNGGTIAVDQETSGWLSEASTLTLGTGVNTTTAGGIVTAEQNAENVGTLYPGAVNLTLSTSEPVNTVTGEYYVDTVDLKLNGPMPLEIRRNYSSQNPFSGAFGFGWKFSMVPYLVVSTDSTNTLIYAAEMNGTVLTYRRQSPTSSTWAVSGTDNPEYINPQSYTPGAPNLLNNTITRTAGVSGTTYTLTGADGSLRTFKVQSFVTAGGTNGLNLTRPYLQTWQDNRGNTLTYNYDNTSTDPAYGQVTSIKSSNGNYAGFQYDTFGHITAAYTGDGNWTYYQYDDYGDLTQVTLPDNSTVAYSYRHEPQVGASGTGTGFYSEHLLTEQDQPSGRVLRNYYDYFGFRRVLFQQSTVQQGNSTPVQSAAFSYVISATNNTPIVLGGTTYHTSTSLNLSGNAGSYSSTLSSDGNINLTSSTLLSGSLPLPASAMLTGTATMTDVNSHSWIYGFANGNFTQITSPPQNNTGNSQNITYQWYPASAPATNGTYPSSLASYTNKRGLTTTYQYDSYGNVLQEVEKGDLLGDGNTSETGITAMTYNTTAVTLPNSTVTAIPNTLKTVTDPIGNSVTYAYADSTTYPYLPTSITTAASGSTISTTLLQYGNASGGSGGSSASAYGLLQRETLASGSPYQAVTQFVYNGNGFPTQKTQISETNDPSVVTYYNYNLRGQVTSETDAAGRNTQYQYDARGNQTGILRYDENGNLVSWQFSYYNQNGEIEWTQGPRFAPDDYVQKEYDGAGRLAMVSKYLIGAYTNGSGVTTSGAATAFNTYDTYGNLKQVQDPNGNITTMGYDAIGEMMTKQTSYAGGTATESFTYEPGGKVATHTTVLGGSESYSYTSTGLLMSGTMADGSTKSYLYDLTGRVVRETLANGSYWGTNYNDSTRTITRTFYNSSSQAQGSESQALDPRGNVIAKTDLAGNTFYTTYDGLNRVKSVTGPPGASPGNAGSTAQQSTYTIYDAAGLKQTVSNALGERTVTSFDALERPTQVTRYNSNGAVATQSQYLYSPNHQSVTTTQGSGANGVAVSNSLFTDTYGNPILLQHADGSFQVTAYDANGNKTYFQDEQGHVTTWTYDALNHPLSETLPADPGNTPATIGFSYNAAGELLSRQMPGGLTSKTSYDSAGRKTGEELDGTNSAVTRKYTNYTYYASNSGGGAATGLLESVSDPRGFTTTTTYDAWMRPSTIASSGAAIAQQNQNTSYGYDIRGMVDAVSQSYASGTSVGSSTLVTRSYDNYGQINEETVTASISGTVSQWNQSWDGAGRRIGLNWQLANQGVGAGNQYGYSYNAAGLLTNVANTGLNYSYTYGDDGLLQQRYTPLHTQTITARDACGRVATENTTLPTGALVLSETSAWRGDSRMGEYIAGGPIVAGGTGTDTRIYAYDARGRVTQEPFFMVSSPNTSYLANGPQTSLYQFDNNTESGIGVRTLQSVNANIGDEVTSQDNFQRMTGDYSASLSSQGAQTQTPWSLSYDALGSGTSRNIVESGTTYAAQTLTSDAWGRLVKVSQRDTGSSDYDWTAVYDGFGRRLQTTWQPMTSGSNSGPSSYIQYFFDPQVEFLELGWNDNGGRMWKVYGPDANGVYGGDQGCGGLENEIWEAQSWCIAPLNNEFGDAEGYVYDTSITGSGTFQTYAYGLPMGEYGCEPGQYLYNNGVGNNVLPTPQWRGHYVDETGFVWMGTRYYEPISGKFLSPDVLGHAVSPDLYSYCGGDGVNGLDGDGRGTIEANNTLTQTSSSQPLYGPYQTVTGVGITTQGNNPESIPQASSSQGQQGSTVIVQGGISGASSETSSGASSSLANNNPSGNVGLYIWGVGEPAAPPDPFAYTETPYEQYLAHAPQSPVTTIVAMVALNVATTVMLPEIEPALAATSLAEIGVADTSEGTITVIGSLQDTAAYAGRPGYNVLNVPEEAYNAMSAQEFDRLNAEWLNQAFQRGDTIMAVTNPVAHAQYLESIAPALSFQSRYLNLELPMAQEFGVIPLNAATPY